MKTESIRNALIDIRDSMDDGIYDSVCIYKDGSYKVFELLDATKTLKLSHFGKIIKYDYHNLRHFIDELTLYNDYKSAISYADTEDILWLTRKISVAVERIKCDIFNHNTNCISKRYYIYISHPEYSEELKKKVEELEKKGADYDLSVLIYDMIDKNHMASKKTLYTKNELYSMIKDADHNIGHVCSIDRLQALVYSNKELAEKVVRKQYKMDG